MAARNILERCWTHMMRWWMRQTMKLIIVTSKQWRWDDDDSPSHCSHIIIHFARFSTSVAPVPFKIYSSSKLYNNESTSHWEKKLAKVCALVDQIAIKKNCTRIKAKIAVLLRINLGISCAPRLFATTRTFLRQVNLSKDRLYTFMFFAAIIFISFSLYFFFLQKNTTWHS